MSVLKGSLQSANLHTPADDAVLGQSSVLSCEINTLLPVTTSLLSVYSGCTEVIWSLLLVVGLC